MSRTLSPLAGPVRADAVPPAVIGQRKLTSGEKELLRSVFGDTLPYEEKLVWVNSSDIGGEDNSFSPGYIANMARTIYTTDFSAASDSDKWVFIHEMAHVWASYHGQHNFFRGFTAWVRHPMEYDPGAYRYDLSDNEDITDYNLEQEASIIADYWYVSEGRTARFNTDPRAMVASYQPFIDQVRNSGPPSNPNIPMGMNHGEYIGHNF